MAWSGKEMERRNIAPEARARGHRGVNCIRHNGNEDREVKPKYIGRAMTR